MICTCCRSRSARTGRCWKSPAPSPRSAGFSRPRRCARSSPTFRRRSRNRWRSRRRARSISAGAARRELPDIDLDIASSRGGELLEWTFDRFGPARVAMVSAHQTFRRRGAFRAGLAALGCEPTAIARFASALPSDDLEADIDLPLPIETLPARLHEAVPLIGRLIGKLQHISVHPGGIVIADPAIASHAPIERAPMGVIVIQYELHAL